MNEDTRPRSRNRGRSRQQKLSRKAETGSASSRRAQAVSLPLVESDGAAAIHWVVLKILHEVGCIVGHESTRKMLVTAGRKQGSDGYSCIPPDLAERAQSSAEALSGIVIHQLTEPGAPVMSDSAVLSIDMRQADLAHGSPEYMLTGLGAADYFNVTGVPSWVGDRVLRPTRLRCPSRGGSRSDPGARHAPICA